MTIAGTVVATALWLASTAVHGAVDVQGPATVIDGNTLRVQDTEMRLWGLEAPRDEWCTTPKGGCGDATMQALPWQEAGEKMTTRGDRNHRASPCTSRHRASTSNEPFTLTR